MTLVMSLALNVDPPSATHPPRSLPRAGRRRSLAWGLLALSAVLFGATQVSAQSIVAWGTDQHGLVSEAPTGSGYKAVAGGDWWTAVALTTDGSIVKWGDFDQYNGAIPTGSGYTAIAYDGGTGYALRADGSIAAWGYDQYGQVSNTPTDAGYTAIAAGAFSGFALRPDGSIVGWGLNNYNMLGGIPAGTGFQAISALGYCACALRADGSIVTWGSNNEGAVSGTPTDTGFSAVSAAGGNCLALRADGSIVAWGLNNAGQVTNAPTGTGFTAISAGGYFCAALRADGSIVVWGNDDSGQVSAAPTGTGYRYVQAVNPFNVYALDGGLTMSLEADPCQMDADPMTSGVQVAVELWLRDPFGEVVTGYQSFLSFDPLAMTYEGALSSYSVTPFAYHIQGLATAEVAPGELRLDGNTFSTSGPDGDTLLATLVFTVNECDVNPVAFDLTQSFISKFSYVGVPYDTILVDSTGILADATAPMLSAHADITQPADAGSCAGAVVSFAAPVATDNCDMSPTVTCLPASGSTFPVGTTTVTCTATDQCGNESTSTFDVTVTATNLVSVDVELAGVVAEVSRCIRFKLDDCGVSADVMVAFTDHDFDGGALTPVRGTATFEVPCGTYTSVCGKDQQHTKWDTVALVPAGASWVSAGLMSLDGGDTNDDGAVEIDDVTWFLAQFGQLAADGGCPWDGITRDADFSDNGAIGSEDYGFLVDNWLTTSNCTCPLAWVPGGPRNRLGVMVAAQTPVQKQADLNGDGYVDDRDVEILEIRHGLSGELSRRMRASQR